MNTDTTTFTAEDVTRRAWNNHFEFEEITEAGGLDEKGVPKFRQFPIMKVYVQRDSGQPEIIPVDPEAYMRAHPECIGKVKPAWEAWKLNAEQPVTGYPLKECALLPKTVVLQFNHFGIQTAEQLIDAHDAVIGKVPDGKKHQTNVKRWMDAAEKRAETMKVMKENDDLKNRLSAMEAEVKKVNDRWEEFKKSKGE